MSQRLLQFLQFHGKSHVALDLDLATHEGLLWVKLSAHHINEVLVLDKTYTFKYVAQKLTLTAI